MAILACPTGFEPVTLGLEGRCSYPTELRADHKPLGNPCCIDAVKRRRKKCGRGGEIRTPDILVPNQARYQATLHPESRIVAFPCSMSNAKHATNRRKQYIEIACPRWPRLARQSRRASLGPNYAAGAASAGFSLNSAFIDRRIRPLSSISSTLTLTTWPSLR